MYPLPQANTPASPQRTTTEGGYVAPLTLTTLSTMPRVPPGGSGVVPTVSSLSTPPSTEASHRPPVPSSNLGTPNPGSTSWLHSTPPEHAAIHPATRKPCDRTNNQATHPGSPLSSKNPATTAAKLTIHVLSSTSSMASAPWRSAPGPAPNGATLHTPGKSIHSLAKFQPHSMLGPASISRASLRRAPHPVTAHVWPPTACPLFRSANSRAIEGNASLPYGRTGCRSYATNLPRSDTSAPSNAPQMGSNVTCIESPEGDQSASHPQLRPVDLLQNFATTLKGGILDPDGFSPTHAAMQLVSTSTMMSTTPPRESFSTCSLSRAFGSLADTRHCAIGSHTPSTTMSTTPPMDSDLTHIEGPERLTKRVTVARLEPYVDSSRGGTSGQSPARLPSHSLS